jgi:hypothetical protein
VVRVVRPVPSAGKVIVVVRPRASYSVAVIWLLGSVVDIGHKPKPPLAVADAGGW